MVEGTRSLRDCEGGDWSGEIHCEQSDEKSGKVVIQHNSRALLLGIDVRTVKFGRICGLKVRC